MSAEAWRTVEGAAEDTGRSHWTIRTWARKGQVRSFKARGVVFVHRGDVARLSAGRPWVVGDPLTGCGAGGLTDPVGASQ